MLNCHFLSLGLLACTLAVGCGGSSDATAKHGSSSSADAAAPLGDSATRASTDGAISRHEAGTTTAAATSSQTDATSSSQTDAASSSQTDSSVPPRHDASKDSATTTGDGAAADVGPYGSNGPHTSTTSAFSVTSSTDTFTTTAYIPSGPGPFPVVLIGSGFQQSGVAYAPYATRLASWGVVAFLRDDPGVLSSVTVPDLASDISYMVTTWLASTNTDSKSALYGKLDTTKIGLTGHSRGGQTSLLAGEGGAKGKILGVFGLDPDDTETNNVEARTNIATIGVPIAFIGETTDSTGGVGGQPCAPAADNYQMLYEAASSPIVAITAVNADHTMFEDQSHCSFCTLCTAGTASKALVLATSVRYLTAFFARELLGDTTVGAAFQGAGIAADEAAGVVTAESK
jgi:dienelactone hydrolase